MVTEWMKQHADLRGGLQTVFEVTSAHPGDVKRPRLQMLFASGLLEEPNPRVMPDMHPTNGIQFTCRGRQLAAFIRAREAHTKEQRISRQFSVFIATLGPLAKKASTW
jgi:hypothetical protein